MTRSDTLFVVRSIRLPGYQFMAQSSGRINATELTAAKLGISLEGATLYCTHQPCSICAKIIVNSGIKRIVYREGYPDEFAMKILSEADILVERYEE